MTCSQGQGERCASEGDSEEEREREKGVRYGDKSYSCSTNSTDTKYDRKENTN